MLAQSLRDYDQFKSGQDQINNLTVNQNQKLGGNMSFKQTNTQTTD